MNPPTVLVPATSEMLFNNGANEEKVEWPDCEYKYEEENDVEERPEENEVSPSTPANSPLNWKTESRIVDLDHPLGSFERLPLVQPV